jgi:TPR repeat protein
MRFYIVFTYLLTLILLSTALHAEWDTALSLYKNQQYEESAKILNKLSDQGVIDAKIYLAVLLFSGTGIEKDELKAIRLLEEASDAGNPDAMWRLGWLLLEHSELSSFTNNKSGLMLIEQAANNNIGDAQLMLGNIYREGKIVPRNYDLSFFWFNKASNHNIVEAIHSLGVCYYNGWGVEVNYEKSAHFLSIASQMGFTRSTFNLATLYRDGLGVEKDLTKAHQLFLFAAKDENINAMTQVSQNYFKGIGTKRNILEGIKWLYWSKTR